MNKTISFIAQYENRFLSRNWGFRLIASLSIVLITVFHLLLQGNSSYTAWIAISLPSNIPYANALGMNYLLSLIILFWGGDFFLGKEESLYPGIAVRPFTNTTYLLGKAGGTIMCMLKLNGWALAIAIIINLTVCNGPFNWWPYLFYLFTLTIPTLLFFTGLTFLLKNCIPNRALNIPLLLIIFYLTTTQGEYFLHGAIDVFATGMPTVFSDLTGFSNIDTFLLQRLTITLFGIGFWILNIPLLQRLPNPTPSKRISYATAMTALLIGSLLAGTNVIHTQESKRGRAIAREIFRQYDPCEKIDITSHSIDFQQKGDRFQAISRLSLSNDKEQAVDSVILYLNPGLQITKAESQGEQLTLKRRHQIVILALTLQPGESQDICLGYEGKINPDVLYAEITDLQPLNENRKFLIFRPGNDLYYLTPEYTLLTPECLWYPTSYPPVNVTTPYITEKSFTRFNLNVIGEKKRLAISQGKFATRGDTLCFHNSKNLTGISLCIGNYSRYAIKSDTLKMAAYQMNMPAMQQNDSLLYEIYLLKEHEYLLNKLQDVRPFIDIWKQFDFSINNKRITYLFDKLVLVETPIHFTAYYREWQEASDYAQPELLLRPEREAFTNALTCKNEELNDPFGGALDLPHEYFRAMTYSNVLKATRPLYRWNFMNIRNHFIDHQTVPNEYNPLPAKKTPYYHITSSEFTGINNLFTGMIDKSVFALASTSSGSYQIPLEAITYYNQHKNLHQLFTDATLTAEIKTRLLEAQCYMLLREIASTIPAKELQTFNEHYIRQHYFSNIPYTDYCREVEQHFGLDLITLTRTYYSRKALPKFMIGDVKLLIEEKNGEKTGYSFSAKVWNRGQSDGIITLLPKMNPLQHFSIPANSCKELKLYVSGTPQELENVLKYHFNIEIQTNLAANYPGFYQYFPSPKTSEDVDTRSGIFDADSSCFKPTPHEYIVDNEDLGFHIDELQNKIQNFIHKKVKKEEDKSATWKVVHNNFAYGAYISSYHTNKINPQTKRIPQVSWTTHLPQDATYEIFAYINKRCAPWAFTQKNPNNPAEQIPINDPTQTYLVTCLEEEIAITLPLDREEGWLSLGKFQLKAGEAKVTLTPPTDNPRQRLIADAVKWVKID